MAKISKETIEKEVISKKNINKPKSKKNSNAEKVDLEKDVKLESEKNVKNTSSKRTIKNINAKNEKVENISKPIEEEQTKKEKNLSKKTSQKKSKRTLHLNLDNVKKEAPIAAPSINHTIDTSINQNSPFFYEPSVFEKFNITITNIEDEDLKQNDLDIKDENEFNESTKVDSQINLDNSKNKEVQDINDTLDQDFNIDNSVENPDSLISDISIDDLLELDEISEEVIINDDTVNQDNLDNSNETNNINNTENIEFLDNNSNNEEVSNIDTISDSQDSLISDISADDLLALDEISEEAIINNDTVNKDNLNNSNETNNINNNENIEFLDNNSDNEEVSNIDAISDSQDSLISDISADDLLALDEISEEAIINNDTVNQDNLDSSDNTNGTPNSDTIKEEIVNMEEVADSKIDSIPEEKNKITSSISNVVGKFFDSSIPNMTSNNENTPFSKIKKTIFSGISPIFKKFTFEEANFLNNTDSLSQEILNDSISQVQNSDILSTLQESTSIDSQNNYENEALNISAEPVATIPDLKTANNLTNESSNSLSDYDINYNQILTPENNFSDSSSIDDELIDELISNSDFLDNDDLNENDNSFDNDYIEEDDFENDYLEDYDENENNYDLDVDENLEVNKEVYNDDTFSIEAYFGLDHLTDEDFKDENDENIIEENQIQESPIDENNKTELSTSEFEEKFFEDNSQNTENEKSEDSENQENVLNSKTNTSTDTNSEQDNNLVTFSKLIENFNQTLSTLSDRIANLEQEKEQLIEEQEKNRNFENLESNNNEINNDIDINEIDIEDLDIDIDALQNENILEDNNDENSKVEIIENNTSMKDAESLEEDIENKDEKSVEDILTDAFLSDDFEFDENLKNELLSEVLEENDLKEEVTSTKNSDDIKEEINNDDENLADEDIEQNLLEDMLLENIYQEDLKNVNTDETTTISEIVDNQISPESDFFKIIDSLSKTISDLENSPDIKNRTKNKKTFSDESGKTINILINKDDIFSISILNETYEIVADFDGISVLSENIHISTPKNNFFVEIGEKYIEIHRQDGQFLVTTNFEDVEFANAINNVAFAKKDNKIELNIKEAFKLASANNKIELSMLNTSIANMSNSGNPASIDENSICDNRTLLISEETQKVYLPYTIEEIMKKLNNNNDYQTAKEVIENEYTLPLSTFKMPIISRFKEAYRFMRIKERSSVYAAIDLGLELMFNSNLNPAIIRACRDLKELNIYLDCLYENEVDKFDCFKIVYKVLPKIH